MKSIIATVAIAATMIWATPAKAQVKFGVRAGLNLTELKTDKNLFDKKNQVGFHLGPTMKVNLPIVNLGLDASLLYDQRSAKLGIYDMDELPRDDVKQQQIVVPINLRYGFGLGELAELYLFAGPQFGFNIGSKEQSLLKDMGEWKLKTSNVSVNVGLGAMLMNHLQLSVNYNIACGNAGELKILEGIRDKAKSNAWQIGAAYYF